MRRSSPDRSNPAVRFAIDPDLIRVRGHVAVRPTERVVLRRQGAGVPREDVDAGEFDGCSEVQEHPGIPLRVGPCAVDRTVRWDGELAVVRAGQAQTDRAGVRMGFAVAGYVADERARIPARIGVVIGRRPAHGQTGPVLGGPIQAGEDVGGMRGGPIAAEERCGRAEPDPP